MKGAPKEETVVKKILGYVNSLPRAYAIKTHGSPMTRMGQPDIDAVIQGRAVKVEVKRPGGGDPWKRTTTLQRVQLERWAAAGAVTGVVTSLVEFRDLLLEAGVPLGADGDPGGWIG